MRQFHVLQKTLQPDNSGRLPRKLEYRRFHSPLSQSLRSESPCVASGSQKNGFEQVMGFIS